MTRTERTGFPNITVPPKDVALPVQESSQGIGGDAEQAIERRMSLRGVPSDVEGRRSNLQIPPYPPLAKGGRGDFLKAPLGKFHCHSADACKLFSRPVLLAQASGNKNSPETDARIAVLIKKLETGNEEEQKNAVRELWRMGEAAQNAIPVLINSLSSQNLEICQNVIYALSQIGPKRKDVVSAIINMLRHENPWVRRKAVVALGEMGPVTNDVVPALIRAIDDQDPVVGRAAVGMLGHHMGTATKEVVPALIKALSKDGKKYAPVRWASAGGLGKIGPVTKDVIPALIKALSDPHHTVRRTAVIALGSFGPKAKAALPAIKKAQDDPEISVRKAAAEALKSISG